MTLTMHRSLVALAVAGAIASPLAAVAQDGPVRAPEGVVSLTASASVDVPKDWMTVTFSVTREGVDGAAVQAALRDALEAAMAQARKVQQPGQVELQSGGFSLQPRYNAKGAMSGWTGTTELVVQGRDMAAIAALTGRVSTMTIANLGYSVSRQAREKVEADVAAQAIAGFRAKAADYAKAFGYAGYTIREVNVQTDAPQSPMPRAFAKMAMASSDAAPLPVEAGKGMVTSNVNGTVQLK